MEILLQKFRQYLIKDNASLITIKNYLSDVRKFANWYERVSGHAFHPLLVTPAVIEAYKNQVHKSSIIPFHSARSIKRHLSSLRKLFAFLHTTGAVPTNPFDAASVAQKEAPDPWRLREFKDFLYITHASTLTIKNYIMDIRQFLNWLDEVVSKGDVATANQGASSFNNIDDLAIHEYKNRLLNEAGLSPVSINRKLSSLRRYIAWLNKKGLLQREIPITDLTSEIRSSKVVGAPSAIEAEALHASTAIMQQQDSLEALKNLKTLQEESSMPEKAYSKFAPFRLAQKSKQIIAFGIDSLIFAPLAGLVEAGTYTFWKMSGRKIFTPAQAILDQSHELPATTIGTEISQIAASNSTQALLSANTLHSIEKLVGVGLGNRLDSKKIHNIPKSAYAPLRISTKNLSFPHKILFYLRHKRPQWYKTYHSYPLAHYFHFAVFLVFMTSVGFGMYQSFLEGPSSRKPVLAALPTAPPRVLSFQGRLTDTSDNPITAATNLRFAIYNDDSSSGSALLWQEVQKLTPDQDGVFSALLGQKAAISQTLFANNSSLYLGVTVAEDSELEPRQQLATVAYAANAETLQGLVPITQANAGTSNVVLALDSAGNLTIGGVASPTFQATGGEFTIAGKGVTIATTPGSDANITLAPDGEGIVDFQRPLQNTTGVLEVDDLLSITASSNTDAALAINQNSTGSLISASVSGTAKFTVDNAGAGMFASNLSIKGSTLSTTTSTFYLVNTTATSLYVGGAATTLSLGASSGTTTINNALNVTGLITANGGLTIPSGKSLTVTGTVNSDLIASGSATSDLGSGSTYWRNAYLTNLFMSPSSTTSGFWQRNSGVLTPTTTTDDIFVGGTTASAATFAITGSSGNASTSGGLTFNSAGTIQTTKNQTLTLGGSTTGNIILSPNNGTGGSLTLNGNFTQAGATTFATGTGLTTLGGNLTINGTALTLANNTTVALGTSTTALNFGSNLLNLDTTNTRIGINTAVPLATLDVRGSSATTPAASIAASSNFAAMVVDQSGTGDLFSASKSGATKFSILNNGDLAFAGSTNILSTLASEATTARTWTFPDASGTICVSGSTCATSGIVGFWQRNSGTLSPTNITDDLLLGATGTSSAKFGFLNVAGGTPTASISANNGANTTFLSGAGNLGTTNGQTLTLGGTTTGDVTLSGRNGQSNGIIFTGYGTGLLHADSTGRLTSSAVDLASADVTGILPLNKGGTGQNITGTSIADGQLLIGNDSTDGFTLATLTGGSGITIGNTSGGITISQTGAGASKWAQSDANGVLYPNISTLDLLVGGSSTASAKFAFKNVAGGTPTASISANNGDNATFLTGAGNLGTTNGQTLTLGGASTGNIVIDSGSNSITLSDPTTFSSTTSFSGLATFNAGATIASGQNLTLGGITSNNSVLYGTAGTGVVASATTNSTNLCLMSGASAPAWTACPGSGTGSSKWTEGAGVLYPNNATVDLLLGSSATSSAKFGFINVNSGTPTASISANSGANATTLSGLGVLGTTNMQTLTLGNASTGNIVIDSGSNSITLSDPTTFSSTTTFSGLASLNAGATIASGQNLTLGGITNNNSVLYSTAGTGVVASATTNSTGLCLTSGASAPTWTACPGSGTGSSKWTENAAGTLYPNNATVDLLLGSSATTSAKFGFLNVAGGTPTASISANSGANATFLTGLGNLGTTNKQTLTLGGSTTGNIVIDSGSSSITLSDPTTFSNTTTFSGLASLNAGATVASGQNLTLSGLTANNSVTYATAGTGVITAATTNSTGLCLTSGASAPTWAACPGSGTGSSKWTEGAGVLYPNNATLDLLVGGSGTNSAKFAFINVNSGTPTASISGNLSIAAPTIAGANTFNLLNNSTLNFQRSPGGNAGLTTALFIRNNGNIGIGTTAPTNKLHIEGADDKDAGPILSLVGSAVNQVESGRIRFLESNSGSSYLGGYMHYDGSTNLLNIGMHNASDTLTASDTNAISIDRTTSNVGIGTAPAAGRRIDVLSSANAASYIYSQNSSTGVSAASLLTLSNDTGGGISIMKYGSNNSEVWDGVTMSGYSRIREDSTGGNGLIITTGGAKPLIFGTSDAEVARFSSGGDLSLGTTSNYTGHTLSAVGPSGAVAAFDRTGNDGTIVSFWQDGVLEGAISVAGTTVSYNAFTGSHYAWTEQQINRGMLVTMTGDNKRLHARAENEGETEPLYGVRKTTIENDPKVLGSYLGLLEPSKAVDDSNPHQIMSVGNGDMWIVDNGEDIEPGDYLISSSTEGHSMKDPRTAPISYIVARAAEPINWNNVTESVNGRKHRKITVLFESFARDKSQNDPMTSLTTTGDIDINIVGNDPTTSLPIYSLSDQNGTQITSIAAFAEAVIANVRAGIINAQNITTGSLDIATENISIGGQTLRDYITSIVTDALASLPSEILAQFGQPTPAAVVKTDLISPLASGSAIAVSLTDSKFTIHADNTASSAAVATIDNQGNASFSGTLRAKKIIADEIVASDAMIDRLLNGRSASNAAITNITNVTNVYNSIATPSATPKPSGDYELQTTNYPLNTGFANLASVSASLTSEFGKFTQGLVALGPTSLAETWVNGNLNVGRNMIIGANSIDTIGSDLNIQPLRQGKISFMADAVVIDTDGNLNVNGNAMFAKNVTVKGTLAAHIITPVPDEDLIVQLTGSGGRQSKFEIRNASGSGVLAINHLGDLIASGSGRFAELATNTLRIVRGAQADTSLTETVASGSAGLAVISANETERTIYSPHVTKDALIYVTATSNTQGQTIYVARQTAEDKKTKVKGSFTVQIPTSVTKDIKFNWWILN